MTTICHSWVKGSSKALTTRTNKSLRQKRTTSWTMIQAKTQATHTTSPSIFRMRMLPKILRIPNQAPLTTITLRHSAATLWIKLSTQMSTHQSNSQQCQRFQSPKWDILPSKNDYPTIAIHSSRSDSSSKSLAHNSKRSLLRDLWLSSLNLKSFKSAMRCPMTPCWS